MGTFHSFGAPGERRRVMQRWPRGGYTTLELLVVVAILAILAAIGTPALLGTLERYRMEAGASELAGALRRAQALAVSQGGFFRVHLGSDPAVGRPNSYRIEQCLPAASPGRCSNKDTDWPAATATMGTVPNPGVVTDWVDLARQYSGLTVGSALDNQARTLTWITYDSRGAFVDPTGSVTPPASIPVQNLSGATRTIVAQYARAARVQ